MKSIEGKYKYFTALSALGVVYGDIGTSPLYALKESFHHTHHLAVSNANILGILSLIFWSLIIVVSIKYLVFIVRADNQGEGGVLALTALISSFREKSPKVLMVLTLCGIFGTALLYGDGMITPAISVLSAVEGLQFVTPAFKPYIIPITIIILIALFSIQSYGTALMGKVFGPITLCWFVVLGVLGLNQIINYPEVLVALSPTYALEFFSLNGWKGFGVLGSVFLVVTGGEALYSDLGHFGKTPIRLAWFWVVLPCLVLNYFGQGAMLMHNHAAVENPFFKLVPEWGLLPVVILATLSTVIASQALITGVFSLTMQAVQLNYIPRVQISHTSHEERGQVYIRSVNLLLMLACIALVITFKTSSNLAAAYGIAVTTTMVITTILFYFFARHSWGWNPLIAGLICGFFLIIEASFWGANLLKVADGGWLPLVIGLFIYIIMTTWKRGRQLLAERMNKMVMPLDNFLHQVEREKPFRVPGFAVYLSGHPTLVPATLVQTYQHFKSLHEHLIFLTVKTSDLPHVPKSNRIRLQNIGPSIYRMTISYGFMDLPNLSEELKASILLDKGATFDPHTATFFLGREHLIPTVENQGMAIWREKLFAFMSRNSQTAMAFFHLPKKRVVEIGSVVEL
jgi:KUP system potassium uptake protein